MREFVAPVLAQVGVMDVNWVLDIVKNGGSALSPFLLWLYLRENTERRSLQSKLDSLSERTLILLTEIKGLFSNGKPK